MKNQKREKIRENLKLIGTNCSIISFRRKSITCPSHVSRISNYFQEILILMDQCFHELLVEYIFKQNQNMGKCMVILLVISRPTCPAVPSRQTRDLVQKKFSFSFISKVRSIPVNLRKIMLQ